MSTLLIAFQLRKHTYFQNKILLLTVHFFKIMDSDYLYLFINNRLLTILQKNSK